MDGFLILQTFPLIFVIVSVLIDARFEKDTEDSPRRRVTRLLTIASLLVGLFGIIYGRVQARKDQANREVVLQRQLEDQREQLKLLKENQVLQKEQISKAEELVRAEKQIAEGQSDQLELSSKLRIEQSKGIQQITRMSLDRYLSGIEISYKPTGSQWSKIARVYQTIRPGDDEPSYYEAPIIAERAGEHWEIDFEPVELKEGMKWFPHLLTSETSNKAFEDILREASLGLLIKWSDGTQTDMEPWRGDYPTVISVSRDLIAFTLRPPMMSLYLGALNARPTVIFRGRNYPSEIRFRSLDANVSFDEIIQLNWRREISTQPREKTKPYVSDPHRLRVTFRTVSK